MQKTMDVNLWGCPVHLHLELVGPPLRGPTSFQVVIEPFSDPAIARISATLRTLAT